MEEGDADYKGQNFMGFYSVLLVASFLFISGSMLGWVTEVLFRRIFTAKKWINPGFLTGPYLPLYGFGIVGLFAISFLPVYTGYRWLDDVIIILIMGGAMTLIEYIAGLIFIKGMKIKLWDYSDRWGNVQGIICPLFSLFWLIVAAFYYFIIRIYAIDAVIWFVENIEFSFIVGLFLGIFLVDLGHSIDLSAKIRKFAKERKIVVSFEKLKESVREKIEQLEHKKASFIFPFKSGRSLSENLQSYTDRNHGDKVENDDSNNDKK